MYKLYYEREWRIWRTVRRWRMSDVWCRWWKIVKYGEKYLQVVEVEAKEAIGGQIVKLLYSKQGS